LGLAGGGGLVLRLGPLAAGPLPMAQA
jgi:hypothetical protein